MTEVTPAIVNAANGEIKHDFTAGQTDVAGTYYGQVTVTRSGKAITFPDDGSYISWNVNLKI